MAKLVLKKKAEILKEFELDASKPTTFLGSDIKNDFVIYDQKVSIKHLKIQFIDSQYYVEDLNSAFGTYLNGTRLSRREQIVHGDELAIGDLSLVFDNIGAPQRTAENEFIQILSNSAKVQHQTKLTGNGPLNNAPPEPEVMSDNSTEFYKIEDDFEDESDTQVLQTDTTTRIKSFYLLAIAGPYLGKKYALKQDATKIGRDNTLNDIIIRNNEQGILDPSISRRHATISYRDGQYFISDKRSKTRTFVNQIKIAPDEELPVHVNDEIEIVSDQQSTIFRILHDGNYDDAPPQKAGLWWTRNRFKVGTLSSLFFGLIALVFLIFSWRQSRIINEKPKELKMVEEAWYLTEAESVSSEKSGMLNASLAVGDLNGQDGVDLVFTDRNHNVRAIEGSTKREIWSYGQGIVKPKIPLVLADLNMNALQDVLVVGTDSRLRALDGGSGAEIWLSPILGKNISGPPMVTDLNNDGLKDIVISVESGQIYVGFGDIVGMTWQTIETNLTIRSIPSAADIEGDGYDDIIIGTEEGKILVIDGKDIVVRTILDFNEEVSKATGSFFGQHNIRYPITLTDLTDDETLDLIVGATNGNYIAFDGKTMQRIWFDSLPVAFTIDDPLSPLLGQFDSDERIDVLLLSNQLIKVVSGVSEASNRNKTIWEYNLSGEDIFKTSPSLADLNKDGMDDVIIATQLGNLILLNGSDGQPLAEFNFTNNPVVSGVVIADLNADGTQDIGFIRRDGHIYKIATNSRIAKSDIVWGQASGDAKHSGQFRYEAQQPVAANVTFGVSGILLLATGFLLFRAKKKRQKTIRRNKNR